jgi:hypothetical protein
VHQQHGANISKRDHLGHSRPQPGHPHESTARADKMVRANQGSQTTAVDERGLGQVKNQLIPRPVHPATAILQAAGCCRIQLSTHPDHRDAWKVMMLEAQGLHNSSLRSQGGSGPCQQIEDFHRSTFHET